MNTRLEIASRAMAGLLACNRPTATGNSTALVALVCADSLIQMEKLTRPQLNDASEPDIGISDEAIQSYIDKMRGGAK